MTPPTTRPVRFLACCLMVGGVSLLVGAPGCEKPKPRLAPVKIEVPETPAPVKTIVERVNANADRMPEGVLLISSPVEIWAGYLDEEEKEHRLDGKGLLVFAKPNFLYLDLRHGLSGSIAEIGSDGKRYWAWYKESKTLYWGKWEHLDKPRIRDMPVRPSQLIAALGLTRLPGGTSEFLGPWPRPYDEPIPHTLHPQYRLGYFRLTDDGIRLARDYCISRVPPFLPERIIFGDKQGRVLCEATLTELKPVGVRDNAISGPPPIMPHRLWLRLVDDRNFLRLELQDPQIKPLTKRLQPPDKWYEMRPQPGWDVIQVDEEYD